jgi:hypothetical protein
MRRLAKHSRNDAYSSRRDYQLIEMATSLRLIPMGKRSLYLLLSRPLVDEPGPYAVGGFLRSSAPTEFEASLTAGAGATIEDLSIDTSWRRFGMVVPTVEATELQVRFYGQGSTTLETWGLTAGPLHLPKGVAGDDPFARDLAQIHLVPETFFFDHDAALDLTISPESTSLQTEAGTSIHRKKCSYCGRWLPIDPERPGALSFHKHNAKRTRHQNECRACKKWRINDSFNPNRTPDQLHESSAITRERRLFLKDPEILQRLRNAPVLALRSRSGNDSIGDAFCVARPSS